MISSLPNILIVGGGGRMGKLFARAFQSINCAVSVLERDDSLDWKPIVGKADIVIVSVPMADAANVAEKISPYLGAQALFCDFNSLKEEICSVMSNSPAGEVVGLHPMFGPSVKDLAGQKMIICPIREGKWSSWLFEKFKSWNLLVHRSSPAEHDKMMAFVQALSHFAKYVTGDTLMREGAEIDDLLKFVSPGYLLELVVIGRIFAQDPDLYAEIECANPHAPAVLNSFVNSANVLKNAVTAGDRKKLVSTFEAVRTHFHGFSKEAQRLSDSVLSTLIRDASSQGSKLTATRSTASDT